MPNTLPTLNNIQDVSITLPPLKGDVITYHSGMWVNQQFTPMGARQLFTAINGQTGFGPLSNPYVPGEGQLSVYLNGIKQYPGTFTETSPTTVTLTSPARDNDEIMVEISTLTPPYVEPAITTLNGLPDVVITTPINNNYLKYNGTEWVNGTLPAVAPNGLVNATLSVDVTGFETENKVIFDVANTNSSGYYSTSTGRYTPLVAGWYQFTANVKLFATDDISQYSVLFYKNGTSTDHGIVNSGDVSIFKTVNTTAILYMNGINDFIEVWALAIPLTGTVDILSDGTSFSAILLG